MEPSRVDVLSTAKDLNFNVPENEVDEYVTLLAKMEKALQLVSGMEDYQPIPDVEVMPRRDIHFPKPEENSLGAWAWRFNAKSCRPSSTSLEGRTVCVKDNICVAGVPCLLGTDTFTDWTPQTDATIVTRILDAGGTITGKAVCENLSRGAVSVTAATGPVHNPYAHGYSVGGSSSGTAALVASGAVDMGIGCDQGGSIRIPAALAGLYGLKATTGLIPYTGIASNDATFDYVGPISTNCADNATLLKAMAGSDGLDDRQQAGVPSPMHIPDYSRLLQGTKAKDLRGIKIGVLKEGLPSTTDPEVAAKFHAAVAVFKRLGAVVEECSIPLHRQGRTIYSVVSKMGNHMGMLGRATGRRQVMLTDLYEKKSTPYTSDVIDKMSIMSKEGLLSGEYAWQRHPCLYPKAVNLCRKLQHLYDAALSTFDVLVMPTTLVAAQPLPSINASPLEHMNAATGMTENTCTFNASGHPALAVPIGFVHGKGDPNIKLPASLQIVGRYFAEPTILKIAYAWENEVDWRNF